MLIDTPEKFFDAIRQTGIKANGLRSDQRAEAVEILRQQYEEIVAQAARLNVPADQEKRILFWYGALMGVKLAFKAVEQHATGKAVKGRAAH